jgi:peptide chain release factor 3
LISTVVDFSFRGHAVHLLDIPDHRDFSEDTYRVLSAGNLKLDAPSSQEGETSDSPPTSPA